MTSAPPSGLSISPIPTMWRGYPAPRAPGSQVLPQPHTSLPDSQGEFSPLWTHQGTQVSLGVLCPRRANIPGDKPKSPLLLLKMNFWVKAHIDFLCDLLFFFSSTSLLLPTHLPPPHAGMLSHVIPWTVACQASLSMNFSRQEYWSGLPFPSPVTCFLHWEYSVSAYMEPSHSF